MDLFSSLVYKDIQVHTHTHLHTKNATFFKLTAIFLLITPMRSCLLNCLLYSSLKDSKLFKEFLLFSYFQYYPKWYYSLLFLHQWLKSRNIAYYSTNVLLLLLLVIVSQSWITHVCVQISCQDRIYKMVLLPFCRYNYTHIRHYSHIYRHAQYLHSFWDMIEV